MPAPNTPRSGSLNPPAIVASLLLSLAALLLGACGGGGGGGGDSTSAASNDGCVISQEQLASITNINQLSPACQALLPLPDDNLTGRILILGTQVNAGGELKIYANGTGADGQPLQLADFQAVTVTVDETPVPRTVQAVAPGSDILSLAFVTDYSTSISDSELLAIGDVYNQIIDALPAVFEGQVVNFSSNALLRQDWSENVPALKAAVDLDNTMPRQNTALHDALGFALQRSLSIGDDGLVERCRPAHMLIAFTDGQDNASVAYTPETLGPIIEDSKTVMIMLGTLAADSDELTALAGTSGAFAYAYDVTSIQAVIQNWSESLTNMVEIALDPATGYDTGTVSLALTGNPAVTVQRPTDGFCENTL